MSDLHGVTGDIRKPLPENLPRDEKRLLLAESSCPDCGGTLSYLGEDTAEQLELLRSAFRVIWMPFRQGVRGKN